MDDRIRQLEGEVSARGLRVGIVAARFNDFIVDRLVDAAVGTLLEHGAEPADLVTVWVPGAFEIPVAVRKMSKRSSGRDRSHAGVTVSCPTMFRPAACIRPSASPGFAKAKRSLGNG